MIKYRDFTYVGEVTFDAIKGIIVKDNQIDEIRYSFMLHFDESEDNTDPKNAAIISWVEQRAGIVWNRLDTIAGRNEIIKLGINIVNIATKIYNLTKE